jgi:hypothetical protein
MMGLWRKWVALTRIDFRNRKILLLGWVLPEMTLPCNLAVAL